MCTADAPKQELTLADLDEVALPPLAEPSAAAFGYYTLAHTRDWYHSTTATLKNALDHPYREWHDKAVEFADAAGQAGPG
ncbi:MAG: hypothetical protein DLM59_00730 [Pseudonocardiales bacterium]|nr:MAG: hypothetical protein DLM59_00730 [Pseudonocardiales bacterium]